MASDNAIAEQLQRIEHKVDLLLEGLALMSPITQLRQLGDSTHHCPCCQQPVSYSQDIMGGSGHVVRSCGCATGVIPTVFSAVVNQQFPGGGSYGEGQSDE